MRRDGIELWDPNEWLIEEQVVPLNIVEGVPRREFVPNEEETRRLVDDAERFVARMEEFLRQQGAFDNGEED